MVALELGKALVRVLVMAPGNEELVLGSRTDESHVNRETNDSYAAPRTGVTVNLRAAWRALDH